jgi:hypothetical protein
MVVCRNTTGALQIEITLTKLVLLNLCKVYTNTSKIYKNNNKTVPSSVSQGVNVIPVFFSILFSLEVQEQICNTKKNLSVQIIMLLSTVPFEIINVC